MLIPNCTLAADTLYIEISGGKEEESIELDDLTYLIQWNLDESNYFKIEGHLDDFHRTPDIPEYSGRQLNFEYGYNIKSDKAPRLTISPLLGLSKNRINGKNMRTGIFGGKKNHEYARNIFIGFDAEYSMWNGTYIGLDSEVIPKLLVQNFHYSMGVSTGWKHKNGPNIKIGYRYYSDKESGINNKNGISATKDSYHEGYLSIGWHF